MARPTAYVIVNEQGEPTSFVGADATSFFRTRMLLNGLKFEIKTGMRLTNKAPKCSTIIKSEFGLKGSPATLLVKFQKLCDEKLLNPAALGLPVLTRAEFDALAD